MDYGTLLNEKAAEELVARQLQKRHNRRQRTRNAHHIRSQDLQSWMAAMPADTYLSALTLPGTHDSAAYGSIWPFVSTQTLTITQQLDSGIRYLDFRCGLRSNTLEMVHGTNILGRTLATLLDEVYTWLTQHPTEALVIQLKEDRNPDSSTIPFYTAVWALLDARPEFWYLSRTTPRLGPCRRRIQLLRRFASPTHVAIDVSHWPDNPPLPFRMHTRSGAVLVVQDHYTPAVPAPLADVVRDKFALVECMLDSAAGAKPETWYLNFASAYQLNVYYQSFPKDIAVGAWSGVHWVDGVNRLLRDRLVEQGPRRMRCGVVLLDFLEQPDPELVGLLVATNFEPAGDRAWRVGGRRWRMAVVTMACTLLLVFLAGSMLVLLRGSAYEAPWRMSCVDVSWQRWCRQVGVKD